MRSEGTRRFEWLPAVLAAVAFAVCLFAFAWQLVVYQQDVRAWAEADLKSRAELAASTLAEPLRTLDFKAIKRVGDQLKADGLRLRITEGHFFVSESDSRTGFFDTCGEPYPADVPCIFKVGRTGNFFVGIGRPSMQMLLPFLGALLVIALAALVGIAGVLLFFFVIYRQRVRIRELAKLEKFRREFIADVSHEIKTPLTGILGAVDLMDGGNAASSPDVCKRLAPLIRKEARRLNGLVQSILDLARLEREDGRLTRVETDLVALARDAVEVLRPQAEAAGVTLTVRDSAAQSVRPSVDAQLVVQALDNLVINAIRHSGTSDVVISVRTLPGRVRVEVEDHGIGIPSEHVAQVFDRFHRIDPSRAAASGGAGLGLAIVRRIARLHGGNAGYEPAEPKGSRFYLDFPVGRRTG